MEQNMNNTFEYVNDEEETIIENTPSEEIKNDYEENLTQDFVTGLPSWNLEPPYEIVRRVNR